MVLDHKTQPVFMPWLFDNKAAWEKAIGDPRYRYDLPVDLFMEIYLEYRNGIRMISAEQAEAIAASAFTAQAAAPPLPSTASSASPEDNGILSQSEIDNLLANLG
jgi:hypothetical protein